MVFTCGILEHHLSFLDLQGNEVMFLIEAAIIEEEAAVLQGGKTERRTHTQKPKFINISATDLPYASLQSSFLSFSLSRQHGVQTHWMADLN